MRSHYVADLLHRIWKNVPEHAFVRIHISAYIICTYLQPINCWFFSPEWLWHHHHNPSPPLAYLICENPSPVCARSPPSLSASETLRNTNSCFVLIPSVNTTFNYTKLQAQSLFWKKRHCSISECLSQPWMNSKIVSMLYVWYVPPHVYKISWWVLLSCLKSSHHEAHISNSVNFVLKITQTV